MTQTELNSQKYSAGTKDLFITCGVEIFVPFAL